MMDPNAAPSGCSYKHQESVGYLMARVRSAMWNEVTQRTLEQLRITGTQASMLSMLASGKCLTAAELAREYGIDASAITRLLDRLESCGLLTRLRSKEDRRVVKLQLTDKGAELAEQLPPIFNGVSETLMRGFTPEEICFLKSMLRRILVNAGELPT